MLHGHDVPDFGGVEDGRILEKGSGMPNRAGEADDDVSLTDAAR